MAWKQDTSRRAFVRKCFFGATLVPVAASLIASAEAAETGTVSLPLLSPDDPAARKVKYTEDASQVKAATKGNNCANCALYEGTYKSTQGPCQIFPGKHVKASGWCSSWTPQI